MLTAAIACTERLRNVIAPDPTDTSCRVEGAIFLHACLGSFAYLVGRHQPSRPPVQASIISLLHAVLGSSSTQ